MSVCTFVAMYTQLQVMMQCNTTSLQFILQLLLEQHFTWCVDTVASGHGQTIAQWAIVQQTQNIH